MVSWLSLREPTVEGNLPFRRSSDFSPMDYRALSASGLLKIRGIQDSPLHAPRADSGYCSPRCTRDSLKQFWQQAH